MLMLIRSSTSREYRRQFDTARSWRKTLLCLGSLTIFFVCSFAAAQTQGVSFKVLPYWAKPGETVLVVLENSTGSTLFLPANRPPWFVYNSKNELEHYPAANSVPTPVRPRQKYQWGWNQRNRQGFQVLPGSYTVRTVYVQNGITRQLFAPLVVARISLFVTGRAVTGEPVLLEMMEPNAAGLSYRVGLSFKKNPGILLPPDRVIPLNPDSLFYLSMAAGLPLFENFVGTLNPDGRGAATLHIPNNSALKGLKVFAAFATFDHAAPKGIRTVSGAVSLLIH